MYFNSHEIHKIHDTLLFSNRKKESTMHRLLEIGFESVGHWLLIDNQLDFEITRHSSQKNILYAFVCDAEIMYIGKTTRTLSIRMSGYKKPAKTQVTNERNHQLILTALRRGAAIEILALPDNGLMHYGVFHLNLAAGLEDDLINKIAPPWNGLNGDKVKIDSEDANFIVDKPASVDRSFNFTLQSNYYQSGFFNVKVADQHLIGGDGEKIELFLGEATEPVFGVINRKSNPNRTPRIMVGKALRDWFQANSVEMADVRVVVASPTSISLKLTT